MATNEFNGLVYKVTNKINGKGYVGITTQTFKQRKREHFQDTRYSRGNSYFHKALRKYGPENFTWEIEHENIKNKDDLIKLEIEGIEKHVTFHIFGNGYNLTKGGEGRYGYKLSEEEKRHLSEIHKGRIYSPETIQRMSEAKKGMYDGEKNPNYGKTHTDEAKRKISEKTKERYKDKTKCPMYGKTFSDEHKKKISKNRKGKCVGKDNPNFGNPVSDERKQKQSESMKGRFVGEKNHFYGKTHTDEAKRKVSEKNTGKKRSDEVKQKMSEERKGKKNHFYGKTHTDESKRKMSENSKGKCAGEDHPNYGKPLSDAIKRKLSESHIGKRMGKDNSNARAVIIDGNYFYTVREAAEFLNIHKCTIWRRIKRQVPGYRYADID